MNANAENRGTERRIAPPLLLGALVGGLSSLGMMGITYLAAQLADLPLLPFDLFDWLSRTLPGNVITAGIEGVVGVVRMLNVESTSDAAKSIEQLMALGLFLAIGVVMGAVIAFAVGRSARSGTQVGTLVGLVAFVAFAAMEYDLGFISGTGSYAWLALLVIGWGTLMGWTLDRPAPVATERSERRRVLGLAGSSIALAAIGWLVGRTFTSAPPQTGSGTSDAAASSPDTSGASTLADVATDPAALEGRIEPAPGTRAELTPDGSFYRIDINTRPVSINGEEWELEVTGLFDNARNLTLEDLRAFPAVTQPVTMGCISNRLGGDLIGTAYWTGARLVDVLADLGMQNGAQELYIESADGFFESVSNSDLMDPRTLLVYEMNEAPLPERHGFPLRIYIPNRYGMKQPKWIIRIEALGEEGPGYWVERGWDEEAFVNTASVIDIVSVDHPTADGAIPVGGIAWAGDRGIDAVEVQVDEGDWVQAELRTPPLSSLTWVQWRYDWPPEPGSHTFRVRATDGTGTLQTAERSNTHPSGATGYHQVSAEIA